MEPAAAEDTPSEHFSAFLRWCSAAGADTSRVQLKQGPHGIGLFATQPIPAGTAYVTIPPSIQVTCDKALESEVGQAILASSDKLVARPVSARAILYCFLIVEAAKQDSFWQPWLRVCPRTYSDPLWWDERLEDRLDSIKGSDESARLQRMQRPVAARVLAGTQAAYDVAFHAGRLETMYSELNLPALAAAYPKLFPPELFTWKRFLWARSFFSSRCYHIDSLRQQLVEGGTEKPVPELTKQYEKLVAAGVIRDDCPAFCAPLMDMLNHDRNAVVRVGLAPTTRQGQTVEESDRAPARPHGFLGISSSVDVAESEECMNNYGGRSNLQLLFGFGFCMRDNPNDEVPVKLSAQVPDPKKAALMSACGLVPGEQHTLTRSSPIIPPKLLATLRILAMDPQLVEKYLEQQSSGGGSTQAATLLEQLQQPAKPCEEHPDLELDALEALGQFLGHKNLAIESCHAARGATTALPGSQSAIAYVAGQQEILVSALKELQDAANTFEQQWGAVLDEYQEAAAAAADAEE